MLALSALLSAALLSSSVQADDAANITISKQYSTLYNYTSPGGTDPNLVAFSAVSIPFGAGTFPESSHNSTGPGDPTVIGVKVLDARELQPVYGAGCGVTDSASISMQDLKTLQPDTYNEIMSLLWAQDQDEMDKNGGAGLSFTRSPLGASDFGTNFYSYDDTADCSADESLSLFTIDKAPKMWNTHKDIAALNPNIQTFWATWSAPAWMKSTAQNCSLIGGSLLEKYEDKFAEYLTKSMVAIRDKLGKPPAVLAVQNEPLYTSKLVSGRLRAPLIVLITCLHPVPVPDQYPGMMVTPEASARVSKLLRSRLDAAGLKSVGITAYDHNWDHPEYAVQSLDNQSAFDSVSWHCYAGSPEVQDQVTESHPQIPQYFSECTRITQQLEEPWINLRRNAEKLLIGSIGHGSRNIILWNCVLQSDENGFTSPSLPGTCQNCNAPVLIYNNNIAGAPKLNSSGMFQHVPTQLSRPGLDGGSKMVKRQEGKKPTFKLTSDYATLVHLNRATRLQASGESTAIRTGVSSTEEAINYFDGERVKAQAYKIKLHDGRYRYSLIVLQRNDYFLTGRYEPVDLVIGFKDQVANITGLPVGLHTFQWVG